MATEVKITCTRNLYCVAYIAHMWCRSLCSGVTCTADLPLRLLEGTSLLQVIFVWCGRGVFPARLVPLLPQFQP